MSSVQICKKCKKRKFNINEGILCGLTNAKPRFDTVCPEFERDPTAKIQNTELIKPNLSRS